MNKEDWSKLSDEELLIEKKNVKKSRIYHALGIGFLAGILLFGVIAWILSPEKRIGALITMIIPITFIYKLLNNPNNHDALFEVIKERNLDQ